MSSLPVVTEQPIDARTGGFSMPWRRWLETVNRTLGDAGTNNAALATQVAAIATALGSPDGTVANIPDQASLDVVIYGRNGVTVTGRAGVTPVYVELQPLEDSGAGDGLYKITRDSYGRVEGTEAATTTDLAEGTNLYYTDGRADARVAAGIATHVAEADPHTQYATTAEVAAAQSAAQTYADGKVIDSIADGDTTHAPSRNAMFDALAGKDAAGAAAAALAAANDFTTDEIAQLALVYQPLSAILTGLVGTTYTPTLTTITNASAASAPSTWNYMRVGNTVVVSGHVNITPAALGTMVEVQASPPIASDFVAFGNASGSGSAANGTNLGVVGVSGSPTNNTLRILFNPFATTIHNVFVQIVYTVLP